jgi:pimeloyl-ACP methyl ester carboxylesterase
MKEAEMEQLTARRVIPNFKSETANVNGVRIHYWVGGNPHGVPVLLWHGFLGTAYSWHKVMPALADAGYAVLVPDMRGFGDSDKPAGTKGYDGRALAEEFRSLVKEIGFGKGRPLTLVAHDLGAPPALLWAADHPSEVAGLLYIEVPVMLSEVLTKIIAYTPEAAKKGSMWWWLVPLAPGVPERLIVGNERAFLTWFYEMATATHHAIDTETVDEYLRTFSGREGVLGAMGVYRAAFTTMEQTAPLTKHKVQVPVVALGGEKAQGVAIRKMVEMVAEHVEGGSIADCGHFVPEERPEEIVRYVLALTAQFVQHGG